MIERLTTICSLLLLTVTSAWAQDEQSEPTPAPSAAEPGEPTPAPSEPTPAPSAAEPGEPAELLWTRALALLTSGASEADELLAQACEAGSFPACFHAADAAIRRGDLESGEDFLRLAHEIDPENREARVVLARVMAAQGNLMWAMRDLQALVNEGEQVSFELGYCLHLLGQHEPAVEQLTRSFDAGREPGLSALVAAASLEALERRDEARVMIERALDGGGGELEEAARTLRSIIRSGGEGRRVIIAGFASVSAGYDSNPVLSPDDLPSGEGGARLWLRAGVQGEPLGGSSWAIGGSVSASRVQSFNEAARPFDLTAVVGEAGGRARFGSAVPQEVHASYRFLISLLDGGQGVETDDLYVYNESHAGRLTYSFLPTPAIATRLHVQAGWTGFYNLARSGVPLDVAIGQGLTLLESRLKLYAELGYGTAWTNGPQYKQHGVSLSIAGAFLSPWWELELVATYALHWTRYPESVGLDLGFDYIHPEQRREDLVNDVGLELGRAFLDGRLRLSLLYRYVHSGSTIPTFTYGRHTVTLAVSGSIAYQ